MLRLLLVLLGWMAVCNMHAQKSKFDYFYLEAEKRQLAGEWSAAMELYAHCLDIRPDAPEALRGMGLIKYYLLRDSVGLNLLRQATDIEPNNPWYLESLASAYLEKGDVQQSVDALERLSALQPSQSDVLIQLEGLYKSLGRTEDAVRILRRIEVLEGKSPQLSLELFQLLMDEDQKQEAFDELDALCKEFPHDQNSKILTASQYLAYGRPEEAKAMYDRVKQVEPDNPNLQMAMLDYYDQTGDSTGYFHLRDSLLYTESTPQALRTVLMRDYLTRAKNDSTQIAGLTEAFDRVLAMPQPDANIWLLKLAYYVLVNAPEKEIRDGMWKVLSIDPSNMMALTQLLKYYAGEKDYPTMEQICRQAANYYPGQLDFHFYLTLALYEQGKNKESIEAVLQGLRLRDESAQPEQVSDMYSLLGDMYHEEGRVEEAFESYDSALVYKEDNVACLNNYAYYLSLRGERLNEAEEMSYRTIRKEPQNKTYLDTYAWILFMLERYTEAQMYIDRVVDPKAPKDSVMNDESLTGAVIEHAGDIYAKCGLMEQAVVYWQMARDKADGSATAALENKLRKKKYIDIE